ncbi:MAG: hypothetical protein HC845_04790 [Akkermansiaceae bacterium]|nr:hypothetical protein [Akkermansiaceae bacterium]
MIDFVMRPPMNASGNVVEAKGTIGFCSWASTAAGLASRLATSGEQLTLDDLNQYADKHQLNILSWTTSKAWRGEMNDWDMQSTDFENYTKTFDLYANAWSKGFADFKQKHRLPDEKMLGYGVSTGGQCLHRLVMRYPELFSAVHIDLSGSFCEPTTAAKDVHYLVTISSAEHSSENALRFFHRCKEAGYSKILSYPSKLPDHESSFSESQLREAFFDMYLNRENFDANAPVFIYDYASFILVNSEQRAIFGKKYQLPVPNQKFKEILEYE